jgi:chromosome partitioning protein
MRGLMVKSKIITILMQKGGTAKTTTTANLAGGLADHGKKVLLVDLDPQSHAAVALDLKTNAGAYYLLMMAATGECVDVDYIQKFIQCSRNHPNLSLLSGHALLGDILETIKKRPIDFIREALKPFMGIGMDYIIIDTSPTQGGIQEYAAWAADAVIIPCECEIASIDSLVQTLELLKKLTNQFNWKGGVLGILPTKLDERVKDSCMHYDTLKERFGGLMLDPIHRAAAIQYAWTEGATIFEYAPECRAAREYTSLVSRVLKEI